MGSNLRYCHILIFVADYRVLIRQSELFLLALYVKNLPVETSHPHIVLRYT